MRTGGILIVALVSVLEIDSSNVPMDRQILSLPIPLHYSIPKKYVRETNPSNDPRNHGKESIRWLNPIVYNKRPKYLKNLKKKYPIEKWNDVREVTRNSGNLDIPSVYLEPPKITEPDYRHYEKSEQPKIHDKQQIRNRVVGHPMNHRPANESAQEKNNDIDRPSYIRDHAPEQQVDATDDKETSQKDERSSEESEDPASISKDRIEFHLHGHAGPQTYLFGFDTGEGDNRQYRMEERHVDGTITGHYGYIDARGKLRKVRYKASPTHGYEEKHHETNGRGH